MASFPWRVGCGTSSQCACKEKLFRGQSICSEYCNSNLSIKFEASVHYCDAPAFGHQSSIPVKSRSLASDEYIYICGYTRDMGNRSEMENVTSLSKNFS